MWRGPLLCTLICALGGRSIAEPAQDEDLLSVRIAHDTALERGRATLLSIAVLPRAGTHLLADGPLVLELDGTGIDPAQRTLRLRDAVDPHAETPRFELEVRPHRLGSPALSAHITAWICRGARCRPVKTTLQVPLELGEGARAK